MKRVGRNVNSVLNKFCFSHFFLGRQNRNALFEAPKKMPHKIPAHGLDLCCMHCHSGTRSKSDQQREGLPATSYLQGPNQPTQISTWENMFHMNQLSFFLRFVVHLSRFATGV